MRNFRIPTLLVLASALGACSRGSGDSTSQQPAPVINIPAPQTQKSETESSKSSDGILSYSLRNNNIQGESELVHSIVIEGSPAEQYFIRFCYQKNCWGNPDMRIRCEISGSCELEVADHENLGQFLQTRRSEVQITSLMNSKKNLLEFVDPFFTQIAPNFFYQVWSVDRDGNKSPELMSEFSTQ